MPKSVPTELVNMSQAFVGVPMEELIGGPLLAVAKAQSELSRATVRYMLDAAHDNEQESTGNVADARTVSASRAMVQPE